MSELITQPPAASEPRTASAGSGNGGGLTPEHIALLWERMTMIYGHKWTSSYGEKDDGTWRKGLADVSPDQIGTGLERCRTSDDEWPPTLPIFRSRCLVSQYAAPYHRPFPKMIEPPRTKNVGNDAMERIKRALSEQTKIGVDKRGHKNVLLPGEGYGDYIDAMHRSGLSKEEFDLHRLRHNAAKKDEATAEREAIQTEGA